MQEQVAEVLPSGQSSEVTTTILLAEPGQEKTSTRAPVRRTKTLTRSKSRSRMRPTNVSTKLSTDSTKPRSRDSGRSAKSRSRKASGDSVPPPVLDEGRRETMTKELADLVRLATSPKSLQSVNLDDFIQSLKDIDGEWKPEEDETPQISRKKLIRSPSFLQLKTVLDGLDVEAAVLGSEEDADDEDEEEDDSQDDTSGEDEEGSYESSDFSGDSHSAYSESDLSSSSSYSSSDSSSEGYAIVSGNLPNVSDKISPGESPEDEEFCVKPGENVSLRSRIGRGATAVVWHGRVSGRDVAIKQISLASFSGMFITTTLFT